MPCYLRKPQQSGFSGSEFGFGIHAQMNSLTSKDACIRERFLCLNDCSVFRVVAIYIGFFLEVS